MWSMHLRTLVLGGALLTAPGCGVIEGPTPAAPVKQTRLYPKRAVQNGQPAAPDQLYTDAAGEADQIWSRRCGIKVLTDPIQNFVTPFTFNGTHDVWRIERLAQGYSAPLPGNLNALLGYRPPQAKSSTVYIVNYLSGVYADGTVKELDGTALTPGNWQVVSGPGLKREDRVVAHELGHNFSLPHHPGTFNLMYENPAEGGLGNSVDPATQCEPAKNSDIVSPIP